MSPAQLALLWVWVVLASCRSSRLCGRLLRRLPLCLPASCGMPRSCRLHATQLPPGLPLPCFQTRYGDVPATLAGTAGGDLKDGSHPRPPMQMPTELERALVTYSFPTYDKKVRS